MVKEDNDKIWIGPKKKDTLDQMMDGWL